MQKIKLLLLLTLLCVGLSESWAAKTYQVVYEYLPSTSGGGFSIRSDYQSYFQVEGKTYNGYNVYNTLTKNNSSTTLTINPYYARRGNPYSITDNNGTGDYYVSLTSSNITDYISVTSISGYSSSVTVDNTATGNYNGTITITYTAYRRYGVVITPSDFNDESNWGLLKTKEGDVSIQKRYWSGDAEYFVGVYGYDGQFITNSNVSQYVEPATLAGYNTPTMTVSTTQPSSYTGSHASSYYYWITISYEPTKYSLTYQVVYDSSISGAGYSLKSTSLPHGTLSSSGNILTATTSNFSSYAPTILDWSNVNDYIQANTVSGYFTNIQVGAGTNGYDYNIYLNYYQKWNDGIFEYSTYHTQGTTNQGTLPAGEVAISLYMGKTKEVTDTMNYKSQLWANGTVGETMTLADDDGDDVGETAEYKYLGTIGNRTPNSGEYFYERTHQIAYSDVTEVTIPRTTVGPDGKTYNVTAIQKWGFAYCASDVNMRYSCSPVENWQNLSAEERERQGKLLGPDYGNLNDHRNDYLVTVRFESPSNITKIGDYAFMSNKALKSIIIPNTVELLGQGIWECCRALTDLRFQTQEDGTVKFTTIQNFTFWFCTALETLVLPEGITTIEGTAVGAPLQYMFSLVDLKLPNTLTSIGAHFVCCCNSLETLTIPAGVTDIDGACFHGCESLKTVYLLGTASSLKGESGGGDTFGENTIFCRDAVSGCKFYTTADYISSYAGGDGTSVWYKIGDNQDAQGYLLDENVQRIKDNNGNYVRVTGGSASGNGNQLLVLQPETRTFEAGKWVTACFYEDIADYKSESKFGPGAIAAVMIDTDKRGSKTDEAGNTYTYAKGNDPYRYHVSFEEISTDYIPKDLPVLILPSIDCDIDVLPNLNSLTETQKADLTVPRSRSVEASFTDRSETATITMISHFIDHQRLNVGDFYFKSSGEKTGDDATEPAVIGSFKKVADQSKAPYIGWFRCFWQVNIDNVVDVSARSSLDMMSYFWGDETDGVKNVERQPEIVVDGIYDMQGRKLNVNQTDLPEGLYIVNGKKVVKK